MRPFVMSPFFFLSVLIGGAYGALFHTWQGKNVKDVVYYLIAGVIGFVAGQILANLLGWSLWMIGPLHVIEASLCCWLVLFIARWLRV